MVWELSNWQFICTTSWSARQLFKTNYQSTYLTLPFLCLAVKRGVGFLSWSDCVACLVFAENTLWSVLLQTSLIYVVLAILYFPASGMGILSLGTHCSWRTELSGKGGIVQKNTQTKNPKPPKLTHTTTKINHKTYTIIRVHTINFCSWEVNAHLLAVSYCRG